MGSPWDMPEIRDLSLLMPTPRHPLWARPRRERRLHGTVIRPHPRRGLPTPDRSRHGPPQQNKAGLQVAPPPRAGVGAPDPDSQFKMNRLKFFF